MKVRKNIIFILFAVIVAIIFGTVQKGGTTPVVVSSINYGLDTNVTLYWWDQSILYSGGTGAGINNNMTPSGQLFQFQEQESSSAILEGGTAYAGARIEGSVNIGDTFQMTGKGTISFGIDNPSPDLAGVTNEGNLQFQMLLEVLYPSIYRLNWDFPLSYGPNRLAYLGFNGLGIMQGNAPLRNFQYVWVNGEPLPYGEWLFSYQGELIPGLYSLNVGGETGYAGREIQWPGGG